LTAPMVKPVSRGTALKKPINSQTETGMVIVG
jgi:hypothetical protein